MRRPTPPRPEPASDWGTIARIYDLEHPACRGTELRFWDEQARLGGGPILELAAGSGRIAIALARKGHDVAGLELSEGMLERARSRTARLPAAVRERLRWVQGDMAGFELPGDWFGLIFVAYNSFWLLDDEEKQRRSLACIRRHLAPGGRFVLDVFPPVDDDYRDETGLGQRLAMASRGRALVRLKDYTYDATRRLGISDVRYYGEGRQPGEPAQLLAQFRYALRMAPPEGVRRLLADAGFEVEEEYGTYEKGPLEPDSPRAIYVCRVAGEG